MVSGVTWTELLPGILVLIAIGNIVRAQIKANGVAQPILREARIALFNDPEERGDQILVPHPNLRRWEHHHRFPDYVAIWRRDLASRASAGVASGGGIVGLFAVPDRGCQSVAGRRLRDVASGGVRGRRVALNAGWGGVSLR